jgi:quercetin dioxygenase-like cupin family protein
MRKLEASAHDDTRRYEMITASKPYVLAQDAGVTDLWWPYGPGVGRYTIKASERETEGRMIQMLVTESRGAVTPLHVHHDTDETFYVVDGTLTVTVGDDLIEAGPGDFVFAPLGVPHAFLVTSERLKMLVTVAGAGTEGPSGSGIHGFFKEVAPPVVEGEGAPAPAVPDPEEFARRMAVYGIELVGPPPFGGLAG